MVRLKKPSRTSPKLRRQGSSSRCCSGVTCVASVCLMLNVLVLLITLSINLRLKEQKSKGSDPEANTKSALFSLIEGGTQNTPTKYHLIFTTDCKDPAQDWQAYIFFYHVVKSKQEGDVTRIVTGCGEGRAQLLKSAHQQQIEPMAPGRFHLHMAPVHPKQAEVGSLRKHMKYFNMPFGVQHWMEEVLGYSPDALPNSLNVHDSTIIMLLDHDMAILRPLTHDFTEEKEIWRQSTNPDTTKKLFQVVSKGHLMAQHTPFPSAWWKILYMPDDILATRGIDQLVELSDDVENKYAAGPPMILTACDFYPLVKQWNQFTYPMYQQLNEKILREPHGPYALAAAALHRPHQIADSFSVNNYRDAGMELFQELQQQENNNEIFCRKTPYQVKPHVLQYSKRYSLGKFVIGKHFVPGDFLGSQESCRAPMLAEPPENIADQFNYYVDPELQGATVELKKTSHVQQMTFLLCEMIQVLNDAATYYKEQHCSKNENGPTSVNLQKTLIFQ